MQEQNFGLKLGARQRRFLYRQKFFPGLDKRPIPLWEVKERAKQKGIYIEEDKAVKHGLSYLDDQNRAVILYNPEKPPLRTRHIIGHEYTHLIMNHHRAAKKLAYKGKEGLYIRKFESEADSIASSMIIPTSLFFFYYLDVQRPIPSENVIDYILKSNPAATREEADLFVKRRKRDLWNGFTKMRLSCPYGWVCYGGKICPWAKKYFL